MYIVDLETGYEMFSMILVNLKICQHLILMLSKYFTLYCENREGKKQKQ
jgi:hypothetical protein